MSDIELVILGTGSQTPTRTRNHNGYLLRWGSQSILFDPGEGTQRQLTFADLSAHSINRICITHFHGDHVFGLPGILKRLELEKAGHRIDIHYPASGETTLNHLLGTADGFHLDLVRHPVSGSGIAYQGTDYSLRYEPLFHRVETVGWRVEEPPGRRMLPDRLAEAGVAGPAIGQLQTEGSIVVDNRKIDLDEVSEHRPGRSIAVVMDTAWCDGALALAQNVDLLLIESTFLSSEEELAATSRHLTARQAGQLAAMAGARRVVLTHFSQRYHNWDLFHTEAAESHGDVLIAEDLDRIKIPRRT